MTAKVRKALLYILICLVILTLFTASLTLGRFTSEEGSKGNYGGQDFEFTVSDMIEISSEDEFFTAIENGYSNIQISDDIDKIIISGGVSEVGADLTIDLNGKELQRNNREPMLDVQEGVRLTIIDTSEEQTGCFYNPVGTVLRVSGGTLTVNAGTFESGPRDDNADNAGHKSEYAYIDYQDNNTWKTPPDKIVVDESINKTENMPGAQIVENASVLLQQWDKDNDKWSEGKNVSMPIIVPGALQVVDGNSARIKVNGNMYFTEEGGYNYNKYIPKDTYLYFTLEDEVVSNTTIAAGGSANYKYSYYLTRDGAEFKYEGNSSAAEGAVKVTVFVYQNVKGAAGTDVSGNAAKSFAAIQMAEGDGGETGNIYVQKGSDYHAYFGVANTYCVQASAGYMAVEGGTFRAYGNSVCVECSYDSGAADDEYLRVGSGTFYSENADTVCVTGGKMDVVTATLNKNSTAEGTNPGDNGAAIRVEGGSLSVTSGATITVKGDYNYGIFSDGVGLVRINTANNSEFKMTLTGSNNYGIYSQPAENLAKIEPIVIGSTASSESGGVTANIKIVGTNSRAIYSEGGDIGIANGGGTVTFTLTGSDTLTGQNLQGIYATGGTVTFGGDAKINISSRADEYDSTTYAASSNSHGIYATGGTVNIGGSSFVCNVNQNVTNDNADLSATNIFSTGAQINISSDTVTLNSRDLGIVLMGGNLNFGSDKQSSNITIDTPRGTGIYVAGGSLTAHENATVSVISKIVAKSWAVTGLNAPKSIYNGVFVNGGSLIANGTFSVTHTGVENDNSGTYLSQEIKSFAVRVESGGTSSTVNIVGGEIKNSIGGGIYVGGGTVTLGNENTKKGPNVKTEGNLLYATATFHDGGWYDDYYTWNWSYVVNTQEQKAWQYMLNKSGGHAVEVSGGSLTVHGGNYSAQQGNGILIRNSNTDTSGSQTSGSQTSGTQTSNEVTINGGTFTGYNSGYYIEYNDGQKPLGDSGRMVGPAASYGLNVMGHSLKVTIKGGAFGDKDSVNGNSAASFFGTPGEDGTQVKRTQVYVYGGTFNARNADAISVFRFVDITFDGTESTPISSEVSSVTGVASLSVQNDLLYTDDDDDNIRHSTITINNGTFTGTAYGIYYACGVDKLTIKGGTFTGGTNSGLYFDVAPNDTNVQLSGGTYMSPINKIEGYESWGISYVRNTGCSKNAIDGVNVSYSVLLTSNSKASLGFRDDDEKPTGYNITYSSEVTIPDQNAGYTSINSSGTATLRRTLGTTDDCDYYYNNIVIS